MLAGFCREIPKERGHLGDLSVDEIMVLNISHRNWMVGCKLDSSLSLQGPVALS
jgi:hypothetical protein